MGLSKAKILVADDEESIRDLLKLIFEREGYEVVLAQDGKQALKLIFSYRPDLVVLDVMMPELDGFEVLKRIRDMTDVPVLMLTARTLETEKVHALKAGADDYVTKPFGKQELVARVDALMRRSRARVGSSTLDIEETYSDGIVTIDFASRSASVGAVDLKLTPLEFRLLVVLTRHANQVLSHDQILELVWGDIEGHSRDEVKIYIGYLRRKLQAAQIEREVVETVRGFGYRYVTDKSVTF